MNEVFWRILLKVLDNVEIPWNVDTYHAEWWPTNIHHIKMMCGVYGIEIGWSDGEVHQGGIPKWLCPLDDPDLVDKAARELTRLGVKSFGVK